MRRGDPAVSLEPGGPASPAPSPPLPRDSAGLSRGDVSRQDPAGTPEAKPVSEEPRPPPFVPFSGGGQRLGGPCGSAQCLTSPSARLPTPSSSPGGPSKPKKSRPPPEPEPVSGALGAGPFPAPRVFHPP